ncbi:MAG: CPBP family intramembrane glutamic endopeptidase [Absicoccus sp.]|uniref:CPBP family intramembrane glutamic endopeptidase n=1 Tax=Absicoccus sp. TaxID=2718527 RepID=UPI002A75DB4B|nr:CPBP family intramembrane glutamic endopeptidase [Absicoccus sp.]MDY3034933.1 CPBP family intramembrane glutamic endopeptidase [Absicoccus sp.]
MDQERKEIIYALCIAGCMALFYISGIPFKTMKMPMLDLKPDTIGLCVQALVVWIIGLGSTHFLCPHFSLYKHTHHAYYGISILCLFLIPFLSIYVGLYALQGHPSGMKIAMEGLFYYVCVGLIEEFFCRGLILQSIQKGTNNDGFAIGSSALIYGLLHIPGMIGQAPIVILMRTIWSMGLGLYFGSIYVKTRSLGYVSLIHMIADWAAIPFVFSELSYYPGQSAAIIFLTYIALGCYGLVVVSS